MESAAAGRITDMEPDGGAGRVRLSIVSGPGLIGFELDGSGTGIMSYVFDDYAPISRQRRRTPFRAGIIPVKTAMPPWPMPLAGYPGTRRRLFQSPATLCTKAWPSSRKHSRGKRHRRTRSGTKCSPLTCVLPARLT